MGSGLVGLLTKGALAGMSLLALEIAQTGRDSLSRISKP